MNAVKNVMSIAFAAVSIASHGYHFSSDFSVVDAAGSPYCIDVERNTRFSHGHAYIDNGRYAIPVNANRHFLTTPKLRDFRLEADFSQTEIRPHDTGLTVWFRDDRTGRTGHKLVAYWDFFSKFFIYLDGKEIYSRQDETIPDLSDSHLVIDVRGSTATAELYGTKVEFSLPSNDPAGYIAFDTQFAAAYPTLYSRIEVVSPEEPPKTEIGRWRMQLSKSQGFWKGPEYNVLLERYESGEYLLSAVLSGTEMDRPVTNRIETGGSEWGQILERLESPYVRIIGPDGGEWRRFNFWNGLKTLYDPKMKRADKKLFPDIKWPCSVSYVLRDLPADFIVAAGYDMAMQRPYSFLGNGPYEQMCARNGAFLHEGERVDAGRFAVSLASPPDKKMARMIPKTVYDYPAALKHAQKGHYFFESEPVSFTAETRWRKDDFGPNEVKCAFSATDVYGDAFEGDDVDVEPLGADEMLCGIVCRRHKVTMPRTPPCGVWKLVAECGAAGAWTNKSVTIFEVLSDDPNGPCPPLASRLPEFVSMPNETKYLETDAFDPWSDGWGASHYYTTINRYPTIAEMTRIWELLPLYRRRWFCWSWPRNMDLKDIRDERNRELIRHCDVFGGEENGTPPQGYEFQSYKEYTGLKLGILRDYIDERRPPLKVLTCARLNDPEVEKNGITNEEFVDLFNTCWADFVLYARAKADAITENFDKYVHEVNPKAGRGGYGPMNIYVSQYKSPYHLTISQKSVTTNDFLRRNGSFWMFEDYHVSCDYPLLRASYWVAGYDMLYPKGRKIYPEIYTGSWSRCLDGAVFNAHPMSTHDFHPTHLRRLVYRYTYGSPHFTGGRFGYWNDYGWHARNPTLPEMEELVTAWGKMIKNEPKRPTKAPYAIMDMAAYRRHGDYLEDKHNFYSRGDGLIWSCADVDNTAEEGVAYAYEKACQAGFVTPVVTQLSDLDSLTPDDTEFVILPPIVEGTPRDVVDSIRRAHERGIALLASEDVCGLEDVFGVKKDPAGARKVGFFPGDAFDHKLALAKYLPDGATVALFGAKDADSPFDIPIVMMNAPSGKGRTVFVNMPPTVAHRAMFRDNGQKGQDALSEAMSDGYRKAFAFLAPQPAVSTERGNICAAYTEKGDLIVTIEDDSPIYKDTTVYPVTFRFKVSAPGIGSREVEGDADFAVVSRTADSIVVRTTCQKDTALFFRIHKGERCNTRDGVSAEPVLEAPGVVVNGQTVSDTEWRREPDGVAVRYRLPAGRRVISGEKTTWTIPEDADCWYQVGTGYEDPYSWGKVRDVPKGVLLELPITFRLSDGTYRLITEANLVDYTDLAVVHEGGGRFSSKYYAENGPFEQTGADTTPWRVMIVAKDLNELFNCDLVRRLCPRPTNAKSIALAKPGRAVWQWLPAGNPRYEDQKDWYDKTKALGFEYYLIDAGWKNWRDGDDDQWACLEKAIAYGLEIGVQTAIWVHSKELASASERKAYLAKVAKAGAVGIKIDFVPPCDSKWCKWYEETLADTAEAGLFVDFHGAVKPTGRERTWPHELAREAIRGHEYHITRYNRILPPEHDTILPFCRLVQGHGDYTPVVFQKDQLIHFTWPRQLAQGIVMACPFLCFGDYPSNYLDSPMREIIKSLPATYDETIVLPCSSIGNCVAMARRKGDRWFIAVENASQARTVEIDLSFLGKGTWILKGFKDDPKGILDSCIGEERKVLASDNIRVDVNSCGGYVGMVVKE